MQHEFFTKHFDLRKISLALLVSALAALFLSCQKQTAAPLAAVADVPKEWQKIETDYFSFSIPPTMKKNDVRGIDSQVMQFENDEITLDLDYGMYSTSAEFSLKYFEGEKKAIVIDGIKTELVTYDANKPLSSPKGAVNADGSTKFEKVAKNYVIGINFPYKSETFGSRTAFAASFIANCKTIEARETAKTILYSIKFKKK